MQYYKLNKIGEYKIKPANFKILPAQVQIFFTNPNATSTRLRHTH